eukprot:5840236-Lingulodinium_polyedra.AAC.1
MYAWCGARTCYVSAVSFLRSLGAAQCPPPVQSFQGIGVWCFAPAPARCQNSCKTYEVLVFVAPEFARIPNLC